MNDIRLYISGPAGKPDYFMCEEAARSNYRLFSMHKAYKKDILEWLDKAKEWCTYPKNILLDSGAFTAWNKGDTTTLEEVVEAYDEFLEKGDGMFDSVYAINLDVIPGSAGRTPTQNEIQAAIKESDKNFEYLTTRYGNIILPVYHQGEDNTRLSVVLTQSPYICVSPRNDVAESSRVRWALNVHSGLHGIKTHGLATTGSNMLSVPFYSVDSATAIHAALFGTLIFNINGVLKKFFVSIDQEKQKYAGIHLLTLPKHTQEQCMNLIAEDIFSYNDLQQDFHKRTLFNMTQLINYATESTTVKHSQMTLF